MTTPEVALTYLAFVWTLLFFALSAGFFLLVRKVQMGLDLINEILVTTRDMATTVAAPINAVAEGVREFVGKHRSKRPRPSGDAGAEGASIPALPAAAGEPAPSRRAARSRRPAQPKG